jgi:hypothetical protein
MTRSFLLETSDGPPPTLKLDLNNWQNNGIAISQKDLGAPAVREVVYNNASSDGVQDVTQFFAQRVVSITGKCFNIPGSSRSNNWQLLQPFLDPQGRFKLRYNIDDDMPQHELRNLRVSQWTRMASSPTALAFQIQFKADPEAHDCQQQSITLQSLFLPAPGRIYPRKYNITYPPPVRDPGTAVANTDGTYKTWPIYQFYGPCTNPVIQLRYRPNDVVVGEVKVLISLLTTDMLEIDTHARTVMLGGADGSSRYANLDFINTVWTPMAPGSNYFRFSADAAALPASCVVLWNDAYL